MNNLNHTETNQNHIKTRKPWNFFFLCVSVLQFTAKSNKMCLFPVEFCETLSVLCFLDILSQKIAHKLKYGWFSSFSPYELVNDNRPQVPVNIYYSA